MLSKIIIFYHLYFIYIGIDFKLKIINFENKLIKLQIFDTAGQERFRTITKTHKNAHGIILMYDITNVNSFNNIRNWIKLFEENDMSNVCKVLVGNNCDKPDRKVTEAEGKKLADDFNIAFFETSPKTNQNINEVFNYLVREILKMQEGNNIQKNINIKEKNNSKNNKKCH